ncbi:hypothetical protein [Halothiobacillus sp.]|uniref:hypothetical protein n=1 Tax=Halothiobacillus sp. TaxID=1891311 RepID=UPI003D0BEFEA
MSCAVGSRDCPVSFEILGSGQDAAKLRQRLSCALGGLGFRATITVHQDVERALAVGATQDPVVLVDNRLFTQGLPRTETLEELLRALPATALALDAPITNSSTEITSSTRNPNDDS